MADCCGSNERSRASKIFWGAVWLAIASLVVALVIWERWSNHRPDAGPHGGPLAEWGAGAYHLEIVPDREAETVTVYVLDRWAKKPRFIDAGALTLTLKTDLETVVRLVPAPEAGNPTGRSSRFVGRHPVFRSGVKLTGTISATVDGKPYSGDFSQK